MQHCQQQTSPPHGKAHWPCAPPPLQHAQPEGSLLQSVAGMSKICFSAPKHGLRNRSPSACILVAGFNKLLNQG